MKFKTIVRLFLLVLFVVLVTLTIMSIVGSPKDTKRIEIGNLSSIQNDVKMTAKLTYSPQKNELYADIIVETYQLPEVLSESFFNDIFLSGQNGVTYPISQRNIEVLSQYQMQGKFTFDYTEPTSKLVLHLFDIEERRFNFTVPNEMTSTANIEK